MPNFSAGRGGLFRPHVPAAFQLGSPGYRAVPGYSAFRYQSGVGMGTLSDVTGLSRSFSDYTPLYGWDSQAWIPTGRPYYTPPEQGSEFHQLFGLTPTPLEEPSAAEGSELLTSRAQLLERENQAAVAEAREQADIAFKRGTTPLLEGRQEELSRAIRLYANVSRLEPGDHLPYLLTIHAALEKEQVLFAARTLLKLVARRPDIFRERPKIAEYFGDPKLLDRQMRRYLRVGESFQGDPMGYALQAYCAWVLNDRVRTREALERMEQANKARGADEDIRAVGYALAAGLE